MIKDYNTYSILAIILTFVFFPAGLICAIIALFQIKKTKEKGKLLALISILICAIAILFMLYIRTLIFAKA